MKDSYQNNPERNRKGRYNVLLVYPKIPPTYWSFKYALSLVQKKATIPPLGLLTVAALLPPHYEPEIVDINCTPLTDEMIAKADIVFTSSMIVQKESLREIAQRCKHLGVPIVAGGPYPTSSYEKIEDVDHFVLNEAEVTLPQFLKDWEMGRAKRVYSDNRKPDITNSPAPRYDLLNIKDYASLAIQYSRGCPFTCEFCDIVEMFGHTSRTKRKDQIIKELDSLYALGWKGSVFFVDDNFIGNKPRVKELLPLIASWQQERGYPFDFFTEASVNLAADDELLDFMSAAGFNMVFVGIETPVEETLVSTGKTQNVRQDMIKSVSKIQGKGIEVTGGFIVGFDNDPPDIFERQIKFIQDAGIPLAMVGLLAALPNTRLYRRLKEEGRLLSDSSGNNTHDLELNFMPVMEKKELIEGYKQIIRHIYTPKAYFKRCLTLLKTINPHQNSSRRVRMQEFKILIRSLFRQSFSSYGHHYLSFMASALLVKREMFPEAVRQAIWGHHLFKITREILAVDNFKSQALSLKEQYVALKNRYMEAIRDGYSSLDIEQSIRDLKLVKEEFIQKLQKEYHKIDEDFRHLVEEYMISAERALNNSYSQWIQAVSQV